MSKNLEINYFFPIGKIMRLKKIKMIIDFAEY